MSHAAVAWAWTVRGLSPAQRVVLLRLADRAQASSGRTWPSVETLAGECELSPTTVREALADLAARAVIAVERSRGRRSNSYLLLTSNPPIPDGLPGSPTHQSPTSNPPVGPIQPTNRARPTHQSPTPNRERTGKRTGKRTKDTPTAALEHVTPEVLPVAAASAVSANSKHEPPGFRDFWTAYPRKIARGRAETAYRQAAKRDGPDLIAAGLTTWAAYWTAENTEEKYIPYPTTWLNQARYLDRPPAARPLEPKGFAALRRAAQHLDERSR